MLPCLLYFYFSQFLTVAGDKVSTEISRHCKKANVQAKMTMNLQNDYEWTDGETQ